MSTCQSGASCQYAVPIANLEQQDELLIAMLTEIKVDMKEVKTAIQAIRTIETEARHTGEALGRAFNRIETLEREKAHANAADALERRIEKLEQARESYDAFINHVRGMKTMAWVLWSVLAGGNIAVLIKLFGGAGA